MGKGRWRNKETANEEQTPTTETNESPVETQSEVQTTETVSNLALEPEQPVQPEIEAIPDNNFAVAAANLEASGIEPIAPVPVTQATGATRGVLPDAFGNNVKGTRICSVCGISESETLAKNPRYSFCKGKCVNCYGKTERKVQLKPEDMTVDQIKLKIAYYTDLLTKKTGAQGLPEGNAVENAVDTTAEGTIATSGANLDAKADELAATT